MEEKLYHILWVAALTPELAMIPDSDIFSYGTQKRSLIATVKDEPGLLLKESDPFLMSLDRKTLTRKRPSLDQVERQSTRQGKKSSVYANKPVRRKMKV